MSSRTHRSVWHSVALPLVATVAAWLGLAVSGGATVLTVDVAGGGEFDLDAITHDHQTPWTNYVRGVADALLEAGYPLRGFDGLVHSTVPFSSGLSSSAALEMATAVMFQMAGGFDLDPVEMALRQPGPACKVVLAQVPQVQNPSKLIPHDRDGSVPSLAVSMNPHGQR